MRKVCCCCFSQLPRCVKIIRNLFSNMMVSQSDWYLCLIDLVHECLKLISYWNKNRWPVSCTQCLFPKLFTSSLFFELIYFVGDEFEVGGMGIVYNSSGESWTVKTNYADLFTSNWSRIGHKAHRWTKRCKWKSNNLIYQINIHESIMT